VQEDVTHQKASLILKTRLVNALDEEKKVRLWVEILDAQRRVAAYAAKEVILPAGETMVVEMPASIENPTLWNGKKNPYLYEANVSIQSFNDTIDELCIPFGVRYFHVDPESGFFLNGEHLRL